MPYGRFTNLINKIQQDSSKITICSHNYYMMPSLQNIEIFLMKMYGSNIELLDDKNILYFFLTNIIFLSLYLLLLVVRLIDDVCFKLKIILTCLYYFCLNFLFFNIFSFITKPFSQSNIYNKKLEGKKLILKYTYLK